MKKPRATLTTLTGELIHNNLTASMCSLTLPNIDRENVNVEQTLTGLSMLIINAPVNVVNVSMLF